MRMIAVLSSDQIIPKLTIDIQLSLNYAATSNPRATRTNNTKKMDLLKFAKTEE